MDLERFRITHSTLIEHYQFIEEHLEGIYAAISGKNLIEGLKDVEKDSLRCIVKEIKKVEQAKRIFIFTDEEYEQLDNIFKRRNFWCHNCYYDLAFDARTGGPKRRTDVDKMLSDLCDAKRLRENLYEKQMEWFEINAEQLREI